MQISTRLVLRLMSASGELLGWGYQETRAPGDGTLMPDGVCQGIGELDGTVASVIVHWPDLHVRLQAPSMPMRVQKDTPWAFNWQGPVLRLDNPLERDPLPQVTVRHQVTVGVPPAKLGLLGH